MLPILYTPLSTLNTTLGSGSHTYFSFFALRLLLLIHFTSFDLLLRAAVNPSIDVAHVRIHKYTFTAVKIDHYLNSVSTLTPLFTRQITDDTPSTKIHALALSEHAPCQVTCVCLEFAICYCSSANWVYPPCRRYCFFVTSPSLLLLPLVLLCAAPRPAARSDCLPVSSCCSCSNRTDCVTSDSYNFVFSAPVSISLSFTL